MNINKIKKKSFEKLSYTSLHNITISSDKNSNFSLTELRYFKY